MSPSDHVDVAQHPVHSLQCCLGTCFKFYKQPLMDDTIIMTCLADDLQVYCHFLDWKEQIAPELSTGRMDPRAGSGRDFCGILAGRVSTSEI